MRRNAGWLGFVLLPTLLAAIYYTFIAADLYASEAKFVVRSPARPQIGGLGSLLLQGGGLSPARDDVYAVNDYMASRDAVALLEKDSDLRATFARPEADVFSRYPNLIYSSDFEDLYRYYGHRVEVVLDATTGITTLTVKTFRPEDSQRIAGHLLDLAEAVINRLNERARGNAVADAEQEVAIAETRVSDVQASVLGYRNREKLLDPGKSSGSIVESQARLQADINATRLRLAQVERASPQSPIREELDTRLRVLEHQLEEQRNRLAGSGNSLAPKISEYEGIALRQEFAQRALTSALASLETARAEARRQQIYLDRVVEPNKPDRALYPERAISVLITLITCFLAYSIAALLLASVREHAQQ